MRVLDTLPDTEANRRRRIALLANQLMVFWLLFQVDEYYGLCARYETAAIAAADPALLGMFYAARGWCEWWFGWFDGCIRTEVAAAELCEAAGHAEGAAIAYTCEAWAHLCRGNYQRVLALKERALEKLDQSFGLRWHLWALSAASWACTFLGRWDDAERTGRMALDVSEQLGDTSAASFAAWVLSLASFSKEDLNRAISYGELSTRNASTPADRAWAAGALAAAQCHAGDPLRGVDVLARLVPASRATGFVWGEVKFAFYLGEGYWRAGEHKKAKTTLEALLQAAEPTGIRFFLGAAHRVLAEVALSENSDAVGADVAAAHFTKSFEILEAIKAENELALAYAGCGRLHKQQGRISEARDYLTRALEIFERLDTLIEPDKVRAELAELPAS